MGKRTAKKDMPLYCPTQTVPGRAMAVMETNTAPQGYSRTTFETLPFHGHWRGTAAGLLTSA